MWSRPYQPRLASRNVNEEPTDLRCPGLNRGTFLRVLSTDRDTRALTGLWRIPPGWQHTHSWFRSADESIFVLKGDFCCDGHHHLMGEFVHRGRGTVSHSLRSDSGALLYVMWDGAMQARKHSDRQGIIKGPSVVDTKKVRHVPTPIAGPPQGITVCMLHQDAQTGGMIMLVDIEPGWSEDRSEHHDCVEESFKISGSIWLMENGEEHILKAGDYFFRPPNIKHGPMRTERGTSSIIRFSSTVTNHYEPLE